MMVFLGLFCLLALLLWGKIPQILALDNVSDPQCSQSETKKTQEGVNFDTIEEEKAELKRIIKRFNQTRALALQLKDGNDIEKLEEQELALKNDYQKLKGKIRSQEEALGISIDRDELDLMSSSSSDDE